MLLPWKTVFLFLLASQVIAKGCNKTIRTTRTVRSPKVTRANENHPVTCIYQFLGYGETQRPSVFELTIQDFQVGKQVNGSNACLGGYVQIVDHPDRTTTAGRFCGRDRRSRIYLTETVSVSLVFHAERFTRHTFFRAQSSVLPQRLARERHKELAAKNPGLLIPGTYCDRLFIDCVGFCDIMSPGYPGFYPRNLTCRYTVVFNGSDTRVTVGGQYFDKFDVWGMSSLSGQRVTHHCPHDYLQIFDGLKDDSPLIGRFCGRGALPRIVSLGSEVAIEFKSSPIGGMTSDGFYLSVGSELKSLSFLKSQGQEMVNGSCDWRYRSSVGATGGIVQGHLTSLRHWYPPGTRCVYWLEGRSGENVWLSFQGFNAQRGCQDKLLIFDSNNSDSQNLIGSYCGRHRPNETYISSKENLKIVFESADGSYDGSQFEFSAFFMFVNNTPTSSSVPNTLCDQIFTSGGSTTRTGTFDLLPNRLHLRRGQLRCQIRFVGRPSEQVRLRLDAVRLDPVKQCLLGPGNPGKCAETKVNPSDHVSIYDADGSLLECLCSDAQQQVDIVSRGSVLRVFLNLYHIHYLAYRESSEFVFRGSFQFLPAGCGLNFYRRSHGVIVFRSSTTRESVSCRWTIETSVGTHVLLKFPSLSLPGNCTIAVLRISLAGRISPYAELCGHGAREVMPPASTGSGHKVVVELTMRKGVDVKFRLRWSEFKWMSPGVCDFLCLDNRTCLSHDMVCDGVVNCPESDFMGEPLDESPSVCRQSDYYILSLLLVAVISAGVICAACVCLWRTKRGSK